VLTAPICAALEPRRETRYRSLILTPESLTP